jgi:TIR domain
MKTSLHLIAFVLQGVSVLWFCFVIVFWLLRGYDQPIPAIIPDAALEPLSLILSGVTFAAGRVAEWAAKRASSPPQKPPSTPIQPSQSSASGSSFHAPSTPAPSPTTTGGPLFSCFISTSEADKDFAEKLVSRLRGAGLTVWYAPQDMVGGQKRYDQINRAVTDQDKLLLILSSTSMQSGWVETDIRRARASERNTGQQKLFPIRLSDLTTFDNWVLFSDEEGRDLAVEVRSYFIPDFSNWKDHAAFEAAFTKLLAALKSTTMTSGGPP